MIHPQQTWCIQIDVTNACHLHCSNCTRLLDHAKKRFIMSVECFEKVVEAVKDFPTTSAPCPQGRRKVVGMIGGEPLMHPKFPELVDIICDKIPDPRHRGLWTSMDWPNTSHPIWGRHAPHVRKLLGPQPSGAVHKEHNTNGGYLNWNMHTENLKVHHQPMLVAIKDRVPDEKKRMEMIMDCWVQREWSPSFTNKGFFFCEVAAAFDQVFQGNTGIEPSPDCWKGDITFVPDENGVPRPQGPYAEQINTWCQRCGACLRMPGRRDKEDTDDVSPTNLIQLEAVNSPRLKAGAIVEHPIVDVEVQSAVPDTDWKPFRYIKGQ